MPGGNREVKAKSWTTTAILTLVEPLIRRLIRKALAGNLGGDSIDHGGLVGLADDDHTQYHDDTRGDARYHQKSEFLVTSAGAADSGKPVKLDSEGNIDASMITDADVDHGALTGLGDDDHTQYLDDDAGTGGTAIEVASRVINVDLDSLTEIVTAAPAADFLMIHDADADALLKVKPNDLGIIGIVVIKMLVKVELASDQSIATGTWVTVEYDTELVDVDGDWDSVDDHFLVPATGVYMFVAHGTVDDINAGDTMHVAISIDTGSGFARVEQVRNVAAAANENAQIILTSVMSLSEDDKVEIQVFQNATGTQQLRGGGVIANRLSIIRIS